MLAARTVSPGQAGTGGRTVMEKHRKPKQAENTRTQRQLLSREQLSISREADYIIQRAQESDARIVSLGALVLFSTQSGDAWILDTEDELALCLTRLGERQPFRIIETQTNFSIEWTANYRIEDEGFVVIEQSGQIRTIFGYPTHEILRAIQRAR